MATPEIIRNAAIYLREFDLSGQMNAAALSMEFDAQECTNFGAGGRVYAVDIPRVPFSASGYPVDDAADQTLFNLAGLTDLPLTVALKKEVGAVAFTAKILDGQYSTTMAVDRVREFSMTGEMSDRSFGRGRILHLGSGVSATGNGAGQELRAISSAARRAFVTLHVLAVTGTPTFTGRVESDDNSGFSSAVTRATFAARTAVGSELVAIVGPVPDTHWRFAWTISGTGTVTFATAIGFEEPV